MRINKTLKSDCLGVFLSKSSKEGLYVLRTELNRCPDESSSRASWYLDSLLISYNKERRGGEILCVKDISSFWEMRFQSNKLKLSINMTRDCIYLPLLDGAICLSVCMCTQKFNQSFCLGIKLALSYTSGAECAYFILPTLIDLLSDVDPCFISL